MLRDILKTCDNLPVWRRVELERLRDIVDEYGLLQELQREGTPWLICLMLLFNAKAFV